MEQEAYPPLPEGTYYHSDLIGLTVRTTGGTDIGPVTDILPGPANDNLVVRGNAGDVLIPLIEDVVVAVDIPGGFITIEPMEGLLELNEKKPPK